MRRKLYYTADEITNNLYTSGKQFMTEDNSEYIGLYHSYITGEVYTGAIWNANTSKKLIAFKPVNDETAIYQKLKPKINVTSKQPVQSLVTVTSQDRTNKFITRYFIQKVNDHTCVEVNLDQYNKWITREIDQVLYNAITIEWSISGEINDVIDSNNILVPGVITKNSNQIKYAETKLPGISSYLTDPLQYYTDTEFNIPKDIN